jgi:hypothetical protein
MLPNRPVYPNQTDPRDIGTTVLLMMAHGSGQPHRPELKGAILVLCADPTRLYKSERVFNPLIPQVHARSICVAQPRGCAPLHIRSINPSHRAADFAQITSILGIAPRLSSLLLKGEG